MKTVVQCDFDGTLTEKDVSFMILDAFAGGDWRQILEEYREGKIPVGRFNTEAFAMVKADEQTLLGFVRRKARVRDGFRELLACCERKGFRFIIVSNGLDFYIRAILRDMCLDDIEVFAAQNRFGSDGIDVRYIGPDGAQLEDLFKDAYVRLFKEGGYRVIYVGNGASDISPARESFRVFATGDLLASCKKANLNCIPFIDLTDIIKDLELL